jgi:spoIIIJ-associated protein
MVPANEFARRYLEDLLSFFGLNTRVDDKLDENVVELAVPSRHLNGFLIGQRGQNLRSLQHLMNMVVRRGGYDEITVVIDIAGYRAQANRRLAEKAKALALEVLESGEERTFLPMSAGDRRVIHQTIGEIEGVESESSGEGRDRHVVIRKVINTDN